MEGIVKGLKTIIGDVEMIPYTIIADYATFEERLYPSSKWICTSLESTGKDSVSSTMFRTLFNYISGKNKPNIRVDMTTPVATYVEPGSNPEVKKYTMGFYIPQEYQENPPEPGEETLFIESRPEMKVLTRRFSGYATEEAIKKEVEELTKILKEALGDGGKMDFSRFYVVGYDPPYKPFNRRNEIWFVKKDDIDGAENASAGQVNNSSE